ncbi:hypothetical protein [Bacillus sp. FJAT-47783]|nr:hypothetical protein [Bacillus sp. FJAT-47783]
MAKHKNTLDKNELAIMKKEIKSHVDTVQNAINLFYKGLSK